MLEALKKYPVILLILLTCIGAILHFFNLTWGAPFYFHPDERNIASAVSQLHFPNQMNPHFFAYGSLPIYAIYFTGVLVNFFSKLPPYTVSFEIAIFISRFYSALFATLLIPLMFVIGKKLSFMSRPEFISGSSFSKIPKQVWNDSNTIGLLAAFLVTTSVGFIQIAHFGTFEMWLTFFSVLLFWLCLSRQKVTNKVFILLLGVLMGSLVAIKISHLVLFPIPLLMILFAAINHKPKRNYFFLSLQILSGLIVFFATTLLIYVATNPFVLLDFTSFKGTMTYESTLALGTLPVFYTGEFYKTISVIFQFLHIYPFLLNPLITMIFIPSFIYFIWLMLKTKNQSYIILATFYILLFLSQAFLFAKWTRYMMPTLPFIYLIISVALSNVIASKAKQSQSRLPRHLWLLAMTTVIFINFLFAISYFITAFVKPDTRIQAYQFAQKIIPENAPIMSEVYDMGIVPFNTSFHSIILFDFYDLDNNSQATTLNTLQQTLANNTYFILPSQRVLKTRLLQKDKFPKAHAFYKQLLKDQVGYTKIYETPCDIFCNIAYLGSPVFRFEQTANVFDRPTVMIFKKI